jgi:hypothetical protein
LKTFSPSLLQGDEVRRLVVFQHRFADVHRQRVRFQIVHRDLRIYIRACIQYMKEDKDEDTIIEETVKEYFKKIKG